MKKKVAIADAAATLLWMIMLIFLYQALIWKQEMNFFYCFCVLTFLTVIY